MIIEVIRLKHFLSHEDSELDFRDSPLWLIAGDNGAGKSAIFDAVEVAIYGSHRGGNQNHGLLVKEGTERGLVEVELRIEDALYRVVHHFDRAKGNMGSSIDRLQDGNWSPVIADSATRVWKWLEPIVPSHDLFRAAVYLVQGDAGHFMSGSPADRMKRFGAILDLGLYTKLSARAQERSARHRRMQEDAQSKLDGLGSVSAEQLASLQQTLREKEAGARAAKEVHDMARYSHEQAKAWADLMERRRKLEGEREGFQALLAQEKQIREDAEDVSRWDRASADLSMYWDRREYAAARRKKATDKRSEAIRLKESVRSQRKDLAEKAGALRMLTDEVLPATRERADQARTLAGNLRREVEIACSRERFLIDSRIALLFELREVAQARKGLDNARKNEADSRTDQEQSGSTCRLIQQAIERLDHEIQELDSEISSLSKRIEKLAQEVGRLESRVESHSGLDESARECPVCAQPVDEAAHGHVRTILAHEEKRLDNARKELKKAEKDRQTARSALEQVRGKRTEAERREKAASKVFAAAGERIVSAEVEVRQAQSHWEATQQALIEHHPDFVSPPSEITSTWIANEEPAFAHELDNATLLATTLNGARTAAIQVRSRIETLQRQRSSGAEPLGDVRGSDDIAVLAADAEKAADRLANEVTAFINGERTLQGEVGALNVKVSRQETALEGMEREATGLDQDAAESDCEAERIHICLRTDWLPVLDERTTYDATLQQINSRRPSAVKAPELDRARGRMGGIERDLKDIEVGMGAIDRTHRVPVADAAERERNAREAEDEARAAATAAGLALETLIGRRAEADRYRQTIADAAGEAETYGLLTELLREGGAIQVDVAKREQRAIVDEVNMVLNVIHDPLQVTLGGARRAAKQALQDILAKDTSDPLAEPRYFAFLSGGEQFRVSLALALALHRRVAKDAAGTLIVDEGFGSLDGNRRDELAREMSDTSRGLLQQGLVSSILISSHSLEVRRHFPYRWLVTKVAGTARVEAIEDENVLFSEV